jgi:hypothetical protein
MNVWLAEAGDIAPVSMVFICDCILLGFVKKGKLGNG